MKRRRYPVYKPSGIEWLGDVPEHWETTRVKWSVRGCINGTWGEEPTGDEDIVCVRVADFDRDNFLVDPESSTMRSVERSQMRTRALRKGELLLEKSGGGERQLVGQVVYFGHEFPAVCSNFVARMPVREGMDARFWCFVHAALYRGKLNYVAIKQTTGIQNLDSNCYLDTPAAFPPFTEQRAIAAFLDRETARIDRLVGKKRELIERLKEKRTALIARTVTRGLPPAAARKAGLPENPTLKPSGVEWLGEMPEHWEAVPLGYLVQFRGGATPDKSRAVFWEGTIPWVTPKDMKVPLILDSEDHVTQEVLDAGLLSLHPVDSVLVVVRGMILAHSFPVARTSIPVTINQDMKALTCGNRITPLYLAWMLIGFKKTFVSFADESAHGTRKLESGVLNRFPALLPPLPEQAAIADYLDAETSKLDALVTKVEGAIERLQEYRTALITAAVTGKIDVREAAVA
ncbi:MAG: restriction endonuclease subunit S [Planctomycetaceae bacterium]|nr:MAG: restriction endonuclease subunit S [Planctomycetaceae bacterium]